MISLTSVSKTYAKGSVKAVDNLSLEVRPGEIFGFIGPNGAGKTTTIKMVAGLLSPDPGEITIGGVSILRHPVEAKRLIGYVPDTPEMYDRLTGAEYLNFLADVYDVSASDRRERIEKYLEMFQLTQAVGDLIKSYSHGMQQKLALTGALLHDPPLWLLDEPMVGLDPKSAHLLKEEMRAHCNKGNTVFFSTHILEVAERLCDRVGIISGGRLIALGTMDQLRQSAKDSTLESIFLSLTEQGGAAQ